MQIILEKFISKELLKWTKQFPDEFYEHIFRLKGWPYEMNKRVYPPVLGKYTNDIVYARLAPGLLKELKAISPRNEKGRLKHKYHQRLTKDVGHPKLAQHLSAVITLMKISKTWDDFKSFLDETHPIFGKTPNLPFGNEEYQKRK